MEKPGEDNCGNSNIKQVLRLELAGLLFATDLKEYWDKDECCGHVQQCYVPDFTLVRIIQKKKKM